MSSQCVASNAGSFVTSAGAVNQSLRCRICGGDLITSVKGLTDTRFGTVGTYEIFRCVVCEIEQTFPVPSLEFLKQLYENEYNFGGETGTAYTKLRDRFFSSWIYRFWTRIDGDISFYLRRGHGRLLDIGCNEGRGLRIYANNGFMVEGLELNENAARIARSAGFTVHSCLLGGFKPDAQYDVAVLSNVLEHSLNPKEMLEQTFQILNRGGRLWVSCPNSRSWQRRVFGRAWINWHIPFHLFHFSPHSLAQSLKQAGFEKIKINQITPALWVAQSMIIYLFSRKGAKTRKLRSPLFTLLFMGLVRFMLFPILWFGNRVGQGDCLLAIASKP